MNESEVVFINDFPTKVYHDIILESAKYAIASLPFTYARIPGADVSLRVNRILKGKIAEKVIQSFLLENGVAIDVDRCTTAFWDIDKRDFLFDGMEWDIKNNYLHRHLRSSVDFLQAPALVPLGAGQWGSRERLYFDSRSAGFAFSFCEDDKWRVELNSQQQQYLERLDKEHPGGGRANIVGAPYPEEEFWLEFEKLGSWSVNANHQPRFVLTGYASTSEWNLFNEIGQEDFNIGQQRVFVTRIPNMHVAVGRLPSLREKFSLEGNLKFSKG